MNRLIVFITVALVLILSGPTMGMEKSPFKQTLDGFISKALKDNPALLEAKKHIQAAKEVPSQAGSLDDPELQFELKSVPVDTYELDQEPMTQKLFTLSQKIPFPGKLGLKTEMAERNVDMAQQEYEELKLKIIKRVKQSYYELCFVLAAIDITGQNKSLLTQFVTIAETKYSVGKGIQQDVIKAQVELSKILDELIVLNRRKETEQARLNVLMNLLPQAPLSIPHGITQTPFQYTTGELQAIAETNRPVLKRLRFLKDRYQAAVRLAEKDYYPNFKFGFRYGQREDGPLMDRSDFMSGFVGINIPLWYQTKQSKKVSEMSFRVEKVQEAWNAAKNQVFLATKELIDKEAKGANRLKLMQTGILPQARQSLESALAGYSVDKVDFLTLLNNQVTLFNWEIKYHRELTDYEKTLAELEHVVGRSLFGNNGSS